MSEFVTDIMLDLETLSSEPDAAIVSIGAACFDGGGGGPWKDPYLDTFYVVVDLERDLGGGGWISASTVAWWMRQSDAAREIFNSEKRVSTHDALCDFRRFCEKTGRVRIWGNGAGFDNVVLRRCYKRLRLDAPWQYRDDRCYRTLKNLRPDIPYEEAADTIKHRADHDAINQALHAQKILKAMRGLP